MTVVTWRQTLKQKRNGMVLMLATFFNPLGFDALFKWGMDMTGSYWITDAIFYLTSAALFILYYYLSKQDKQHGQNKTI